jgi:hypothetical protein
MAKVCTQCGKEWPDQFKFCPECGGDVIEKKSTEAGNDFSINMHGSAVNGGIHKTDSHNVSHNVDSHEIHTTTNNTTQNVTNYVQQAAKSAEESIRERKYEFRQYCEKIIQKGVLSSEGKILLDEKMYALGLEREEGEAIIISVKRSKMRSSSEMNALAKIKLDSAKTSIKLNSPNLKRSLSELKALSLIYDNEELHFYYNMLLSALDAKQCINRYEDRKVDSYWMAFWVYLAYIKTGDRESAEQSLASLITFVDMPEGNLILLDAAGRINEIIGNEDAKESQLQLLENASGDCSDLLADFKESLIAIYSNKMDKPDFFATYFSFGLESSITKKKETPTPDGQIKPTQEKEAPASSPKRLTVKDIVKKYSNSFGDLIEIPKEEHEAAFQHITEAAKSNDAAALFLLSELYLKGIGVKKSMANAFKYIKQASGGGFSHAGVIMGEYYLYGYGIKQDLEEARNRLISTENNNPRVLFLRGELFAAKKADGISKIWYQKAADAGSIPAKEKLGLVESKLEKKTKIASTTPATGEITKVWIEIGVSNNSLTGAFVHRQFTVDEMQNRSIVVRDTYFWSAGAKLLSKDDRYKTNEGQLTSSELARPGFVNAIYEDFSLFIPYSAFPLMKDGIFNLKLKAGVYNGGNNTMITEITVDIVFSKSGNKVSLNLK